MSQTETEFWAAETARRMAEYNTQAHAAAARQHALHEPHWTEREDGRRHEALGEERERQARKRAAEAATSARANAARIARYGPSWSDVDWDGLSVTEQTYQAQQAAADRHRRWAAYAAAKPGYDVRPPPDCYK
jgi:hypothetical protein